MDVCELFGCTPLSWDEGFISADGHAWCLGVDLLKCPKIDTGNTVTLQINVLPFKKDPVSVRCNIYSVSANLFTEKPPIKSVSVAIGKHDHYHVLFTDMNAMTSLLEHMSKGKEVLEETFNGNHPELVKYFGPSKVREERVNAANSLFGLIPSDVVENLADIRINKIYDEGLVAPKEGASEMDKQHTREILKEILLQFDSSLTETTADNIVSDLLETVDFDDPNIAKHDLQWIAENFYAAHYLHAGWNNE